MDAYLDLYDVRTSHAIDVDAGATATYAALQDIDLGRSAPVLALFALRALPHLVTGKARPSRSLTLETFGQLGFVTLEENPPNDLVLGAVGKFWRPDSGLVRVSRDQFQSFVEPGYAKAVLAFSVEEHEGGSVLATETRVACTDPSSLRKFSLYWRAVGPFSGFIRQIMLDQVKRAAEAA